MPIIHPKKDSAEVESPEKDVKVVSEEEYRASMEKEIREKILAELKANPKKKKEKLKTDTGSNRHQFSLRFQPSMFEWLTQAAENESRSITNLITTYLELVQHIPTWELRQILDAQSGSKRRSKRNR